MAEENLIIDEGRRSYFVQLPFLIDDSGLTVYAVRLYLHLKRRAGDTGACWESTTNMGIVCKISRGTVSKAKQELFLAGLISITNQHSKHGGRDYHEIRIIDIWEKNKARYTSSSGELAYPSCELASTPGVPKYIPLSNGTNEIDQGQQSCFDYAAGAAAHYSSKWFRNLHPILQVFKQETNCLPRKEQRDEVIKMFGGDDVDLIKLRATVRTYHKIQGWSPKSYLKMAEKYKNDWHFNDDIVKAAYARCLEEVISEQGNNGG